MEILQDYLSDRNLMWFLTEFNNQKHCSDFKGYAWLGEEVDRNTRPDEILWRAFSFARSIRGNEFWLDITEKAKRDWMDEANPISH